MKNKFRLVNVTIASAAILVAPAATAVTNLFFTGSQSMFVVSSNFNAVTIQSGDYRFTYSADGYFTGGVGLTNPVGRFFSVNWPTGVQAQAITVGPLLGTGANITLKRVDGKPFGLQSFTGKILLNTAGAGAAFEIMPLLNGNDAFANPLQFDCTGYGGQSFSYAPPALANYDTYKIHMWGDFALTALALTDTNAVAPPLTNTIAVTISPAGAGTVSGAGAYAAGATALLTATPHSGFAFSAWTENGSVVETLPDYRFVVAANRTLVAVFLTNTPPLAFGGTFHQLTNTPLAISIADLMAFDYDPDGDPIVFAGTRATTTNGLALSNDGIQIFVPANSVADSFAYTIADSHGATATGTATVTTITSPTSQALALDLVSTAGTATVNFLGVPWYTYTAQRATNAAFTGTLQTWSVHAWADGSMNIRDDYADLSGQPAQAFYRLSFP